MNKKQFGFASTLIAFATAALSVACADQPKPKCYAGHGEFAARLTPTGSSAGNPACTLRTETFGIAAYNDIGENGAPNLDSVPVAIQPVSLAFEVQRTKAGFRTHNLGKFTSGVPDDNEFCTIPSTDVRELTLAAYAGAEVTPALPEAEEGEDPPTEEVCEDYSILEKPARTISYSWTNLRFYVVATAAGTQFRGDYKYTENGVTCDYDVIGVYPALGCGTQKAVAENPTCRDTDRDDSVCEQNPNVNPDFDLVCEEGNDLDIGPSAARQGNLFEPTKFLCVPRANSFPSLVGNVSQ